MKIGVATSNTNFIGGLLEEIDKVRDHDVRCYEHTTDLLNMGWQIGRMCSECDAVFVDFAQDPLLTIMMGFGGRLIVRAHRLEMYAAGIEEWPWDRVECLVFIADHVRERFMGRLTGARPRSVVTLPHVGVNLDMFKPQQRSWAPPYRILLAGNVVPKKRQYTAVQMLADMPEDVCLSIIGKCGTFPGYGNDEYGANVTDIVDDLGLKPRVSYQDHIPQETLASYMGECTWIGSWSNEEGCHTTVAEGMATGLIPLVSSWRGAEAMYGEEAIWRTPMQCYAKVNAFIEAEAMKSPEQYYWLHKRFKTRPPGEQGVY